MLKEAWCVWIQNAQPTAWGQLHFATIRAVSSPAREITRFVNGISFGALRHDPPLGHGLMQPRVASRDFDRGRNLQKRRRFPGRVPRKPAPRAETGRSAETPAPNPRPTAGGPLRPA